MHIDVKISGGFLLKFSSNRKKIQYNVCAISQLFSMKHSQYTLCKILSILYVKFSVYFMWKFSVLCYLNTLYIQIFKMAAMLQQQYVVQETEPRDWAACGMHCKQKYELYMQQLAPHSVHVMENSRNVRKNTVEFQNLGVCAERHRTTEIQPQNNDSNRRAT